MKNILKPLKGYCLLLTLLSILLPKSLSGNTKPWTQLSNDTITTDTIKQVDTISKKTINIYLAKGLEARKLVFVLRERISLDSQIIAAKDTTIVKYQILDKEWADKFKGKEKELADAIKREQIESLWKKIFQGTTLVFFTLFVTK